MHGSGIRSGRNLAIKATRIGASVGAKTAPQDVNALSSVVPKRLGSGSLVKHHTLPQKFRPWFKKCGISNIDDYTVIVGQSTHQRGIHGKGLGYMQGKWNERWAEYIKANPNATPSEIFHKLEGMLKDFGINSRYVPYKLYEKYIDK